MKEFTCCFSGPRPFKLPWENNEQNVDCLSLKYKLYSLIEDKVKEGYIYFISGMAQGFDIYCAEAVIELKKICSHVKLECALPCKTQADLLNGYDLVRYLNIISNCDNVTTISDVYTPECMMTRNKYMVDSSSLLICFFDGSKGGTGNTYNYALKKNIKILNLADSYYNLL